MLPQIKVDKMGRIILGTWPSFLYA